jgi:hypothetical protein
LIDTDAVRVPIAVGWNVTAIVQFAFAGSEVPHVCVWLKSDGFAPVIEMLLIVKSGGPRFVSVTVLAFAVWPTATAGEKVMLDADSLTCGRRPKILKLDFDPTYTFPFAMVGTVNLTAAPALSRLFAA